MSNEEVFFAFLFEIFLSAVRFWDLAFAGFDNRAEWAAGAA